MSKTLIPSELRVTTRDDKGRKFIEVVAAAYDKAGLSEEEAQHVNEATGLKELIDKHIADNRTPNQFANEEVVSNYGYLSGYKPKSLAEQIARLKELFPGLGDANQDLLLEIEKGEVKLPKHAEGWFAIPNWLKNPQIFGSTYFGSTYSEALLKVLKIIKQTRSGKFYNYREDQLDEKRLRQSARTQKFFLELSEVQGNPDILIVPAQFGLRHRGRSIRRAREVFLANEFGFGAFAVGIMLLTHPERLQNVNDLWVDCAGDEFAPGADGCFDRAPCFGFSDGRLGFGASTVDDVVDDYGSASGFLPQ
ncbi:MAG: hypothetical protein WC610_03465 [Patescibacteria group bacterium]